MPSHSSRVWLFATLWTVARQAPLSMGFSRQEHWGICYALFQGIFQLQGSNPCLLWLLRGRHVLYCRATGEALQVLNLGSNRKSGISEALSLLPSLHPGGGLEGTSSGLQAGLLGDCWSLWWSPISLLTTSATYHLLRLESLRYSIFVFDYRIGCVGIKCRSSSWTNAQNGKEGKNCLERGNALICS